MKYIVGIPLSIGWFVRNFNVIFICLKCHGLRVTWWVSLVDRKRLTLPEHMTPPRIFAGSYCSMYGFLCSVFVDRCLFLLLLATALSVFFYLRLLVTPLATVLSVFFYLRLLATPLATVLSIFFYLRLLATTLQLVSSNLSLEFS